MDLHANTDMPTNTIETPLDDIDVNKLTANQLKEYTELRGRYLDIVANESMSRQKFFQQFLDPRRDLNKECGYPDPSMVTPTFLKNLFDTEGVASRVVTIMAEECWQEQPDVYEDEDEDVITPFEKDWHELPKTLNGDSLYEDETNLTIWDHLKRVDELSGIGRFGVLLLGFDDGLNLAEPVPGFESQDTGDTQTIPNNIKPKKSTAYHQPIAVDGSLAQYQPITFQPKGDPSSQGSKGGKRRLLYMRAFDESLVQVTQYEASMYSPRFGLPVQYQITLNDPNNQGSSGIGLPMATVSVHWSRVIHLPSDRLTSSEVFGASRLSRSLHRLLDLAKLYAGSAEMYWKGAFPGISFETHPQLGGEAKVDANSIRRQMYQWQNDLQRFLLTTGMSAKTLAPQVVDPTPQIETQIEAICIEEGIPKRIFMGSERGELASSQDDKSWGLRLKFRKTMVLTPRLIVPFVDRLIKAKVLSEPKSFNVKWTEIDALSPTEKAAIAQQLTTALSAYVSGGVENVMDLTSYLINVLGWDKELVEEIVEAAMEQEQEDMLSQVQDAQQQFDEDGNPIDDTSGDQMVGDEDSMGDPMADEDTEPATNTKSNKPDFSLVLNLNPEGHNQYTGKSVSHLNQPNWMDSIKTGDKVKVLGAVMPVVEKGHWSELKKKYPHEAQKALGMLPPHVKEEMLGTTWVLKHDNVNWLVGRAGMKLFASPVSNSYKGRN